MHRKPLKSIYTFNCATIYFHLRNFHRQKRTNFFDLDLRGRRTELQINIFKKSVPVSVKHDHHRQVRNFLTSLTTKIRTEITFCCYPLPVTMSVRHCWNRKHASPCHACIVWMSAVPFGQYHPVLSTTEVTTSTLFSIISNAWSVIRYCRWISESLHFFFNGPVVYRKENINVKVLP